MRYIIAILLSALLANTSLAAVTLNVELEAAVIGTAIDAEYDGNFETLYNALPISSDSYGRFIIGRVTEGSFISERRAILEYDLSVLTGDQIIYSATLVMPWINGGGLEVQHNFYGYAGSGLLNVNNALNTQNLIVSGVDRGCCTVGTIVDVTSFIQELIEGGEIYAGFIGTETIDNANTNYAARPDYLVSTNTPDGLDDDLPCSSFPEICAEYDTRLIRQTPRLILEVTTVPLPATAWLFVSAVAGLAGARYTRS